MQSNGEAPLRSKTTPIEYHMAAAAVKAANAAFAKARAEAMRTRNAVQADPDDLKAETEYLVAAASVVAAKERIKELELEFNLLLMK
jgi:hypothetical protein